MPKDASTSPSRHFPPSLARLKRWAIWLPFRHDRPDFRKDPFGAERIAQEPYDPSRFKYDKLPCSDEHGFSLKGFTRGEGLQRLKDVRTWHLTARGCGGAAFILTQDDPEDLRLVFVDLDGCIDRETGEITEPLAERIIRACAFEVYMALSQSGTGVHILARIPEGVSLPWTGNSGLGVEVYVQKRLVALTGRTLPESAPDVGELPAEVIEILSEPRFAEKRKRRGDSSIADRHIEQLAPKTVRREDLELALSRIDPSIKRDEGWLSTIFSLKHAEPSELGIELAIAWSAGDFSDDGVPDNYEDGVDRQIEGIFAEPWDPDRSPQATVRTLFNRARLELPEEARDAPGLDEDFGEVRSAEAEEWTARYIPREDWRVHDEEPEEEEGRPEPEPEEEPEPGPDYTDAYRPLFEEALRAAQAGETVLVLPELGMPGLEAVTRLLSEAGFIVNLFVETNTEVFGAAARLRLHGLKVASQPGRAAKLPGKDVSPCRRGGIINGGTSLGLQAVGNAVCFDPKTTARCPHFGNHDPLRNPIGGYESPCMMIRMLAEIPGADVVVQTMRRALLPIGAIEENLLAQRATVDNRPVISVFSQRDLMSATSQTELVYDKLLKLVAGDDTLPGVMRGLARDLRAALATVGAETVNDWPRLREEVSNLGTRAELAMQAWDGPTELGAPYLPSGTLKSRLKALAPKAKAVGVFVELLRAVVEGNPSQVMARRGYIAFAPVIELSNSNGRFTRHRVVTVAAPDTGEAAWLAAQYNGVDSAAAPDGMIMSRPVPIRLQVDDADFAASRWSDLQTAATLTALMRVVSMRFGKSAIATNTKLGRPKGLETIHVPMNGPKPSHGLDRMQQLGALVVAGRVRIAARKAWLRAAAIDGTIADYTGDPDEAAPMLAQLLRQEIHQSQMVALLDRVSFDGDGVVLYLSKEDLPPGLRPHYRFSESDLLKPARLLELADRLDGVVPLSAKWLLENLPDDFGTRRQAEKFIEQVRKGPLARSGDAEFEQAWLWREVEAGTARSRGRKGRTVQAVTCLADLDLAREVLGEHLEE